MTELEQARKVFMDKFDFGDEVVFIEPEHPKIMKTYGRSSWMDQYNSWWGYKTWDYSKPKPKRKETLKSFLTELLGVLNEYSIRGIGVALSSENKERLTERLESIEFEVEE